MQRAVLLTILLLGAGLAGCIGSTDDDLSQTATPGQDLAQANELAFTPATEAAHPAFGFPTPTAPTAGLQGELPAYWNPPQAVDVPAEISAMVHETRIDDTEERGAGIAIFGSLAVVPGFVDQTTIYDISDPTDPQFLSELEDPPARDVDIMPLPDGTLYAVFATDTGAVPVFDITDPLNPEKVATIEPDRGSHNIGVVPGTPLIYNSASAGGGSNLQGQGNGGTAIYDLSDPANPELVQDFMNGYSCHDITFYIDAQDEKYRAYCAGIEMTQIWDIEDPEDPEVIVNVPVHHGVSGTLSAAVAPAAFSHLAMVNHDASILIVGDETGGGVAPACDVNVEAGGQQASGPVGNLWFYDLSNEEDPQIQGWISPTHHYTSNPPHDDRFTEIGGAGVPAGCTAHFGQLLPQEDTIAMAFYGAGVVIIDFSDPMNPHIVDQWNPNTNVWDVQFYQGYLITGDLARGMDVLTLE